MFSKLINYSKKSGPGWIQAAVTLGGGSLVSSMYLGVIGGYEFLWLQPLAMICGVIMLMAIAHVTLSFSDLGKRPFGIVKDQISPAIAWGWLIATVIANVVFCSSQFALATDTIQTNLGFSINSYIITSGLFIIAFGLTYLSRIHKAWSELINNVLKVLVSLIVMSFILLAFLLIQNGSINLGEILSGLIPDFSKLTNPVNTLEPFIDRTGADASYWRDLLVGNQRDVIIGAFGTAVGINMTFLLPYSLLSKGWSKKDIELSRFDLGFGLLIPFVLASSCLVLVSASQFHANTNNSINEQAYRLILDKKLTRDLPQFAQMSVEQKEQARNDAPKYDQEISKVLAKRNTYDLSATLKPILGRWAVAIFGIGVLAMALSTMLVHMMMNGYAIGEAFGQPFNNRIYLYGAAIPAMLGVISPIIWSGSIKTALVIPASVIATIFLPIAYIAFILLMNSKGVLSLSNLGKYRWIINVLMIMSTTIACFASLWAISGKMQSALFYERVLAVIGLIVFVLTIVVGIWSFIKREREYG